MLVIRLVILFLFFVQQTNALEGDTLVRLDGFTISFNENQFPFQTIEQNHFSAGIEYGTLPASFVIDAKSFLTRAKFQSKIEFISFYKGILDRRTANDKKHRILSFEYAPFQHGEMICGKYIYHMEDTRSDYADYGVIMIQAQGLGCVHPLVENKIIEATYSVRNRNGKIVKKYKEIGEKFLNSIAYE